MAGERTVRLLFPQGYDDPGRASGGNTYDRQVRDGLLSLGWTVVDQQVSDGWPTPGPAAVDEVERRLADSPDGAVVLVDGLLSSAEPPLLRHAARLHLVLLVHMPGDPGGPSRALLDAARLVITTSAWTAGVLLRDWGPSRAADRVVVATPGADRADPAVASANGARLLCVAPVVPAKGHDVLVGALTQLTQQTQLTAASGPAPDWGCTCVGALDRDPGFVRELRHRVAEAGLTDRVRFVGVRTGAALDRTYSAADLLVLPTRLESYGMVVTEALARGIPVLASDVGGVPEAMGHAGDGARPGLLVPAGDVQALSDGVSAWLSTPELRAALHGAALDRRGRLTGWEDTARTVSAALTLVGAS